MEWNGRGWVGGVEVRCRSTFLIETFHVGLKVCRIISMRLINIRHTSLICDLVYTNNKLAI